jgi:hypothetical protein
MQLFRWDLLNILFLQLTCLSENGEGISIVTSAMPITIPIPIRVSPRSCWGEERHDHMDWMGSWVRDRKKRGISLASGWKCETAEMPVCKNCWTWG